MIRPITSICINCDELIEADAGLPKPSRVWHHTDRPPESRTIQCDLSKPTGFTNVARPTIEVRKADQ